MNDRSAMFIDLEGFGHLWRTDRDSLWGLSDLMLGIYVAGSRAAEAKHPRFFAHHLGDGFAIVDDFATPLDTFIGLAVALHQFVLLKSGHFCGSAISRGELADVIGCYPKEIQRGLHDGVVRMGEGLMTVFPVMGTAIINSYKLLGRKPRGSAVVIAPEDIPQTGGIVSSIRGGVCSVDWIHSSSPEILRARQMLGVEAVTEERLVTACRDLFVRNRCQEDWISNTREFLHLQ